MYTALWLNYDKSEQYSSKPTVNRGLHWRALLPPGCLPMVQTQAAETKEPALSWLKKTQAIRESG
ncbi:hypothetical protein GCM10011338_29670 [Alteromonas lipolytica]|nr:hypothetical protein GCM10011338_29670 [Alteromonas lipolytica]